MDEQAASWGLPLAAAASWATLDRSATSHLRSRLLRSEDVYQALLSDAGAVPPWRRFAWEVPRCGARASGRATRGSGECWSRR